MQSVLVCGDDCAPLSWDALHMNLSLSAGAWILLLALGLVFRKVVVAGSTWHERFEGVLDELEWRCRSLPFVRIYMVAALAQTGLYCARTITKSVNDIEFLVEVAACAIYAIDFLPSWAMAHLEGQAQGLHFMLFKAVVDCLLMPSVLCMAVVPQGRKKSWTSLSFLAALHLYEGWGRFMSSKAIYTEVQAWKLTDVAVSTAIMILFAALSVMTLEDLGDPAFLSDFSAEEWNAISALYFVVSTAATVGYGDLAPRSSGGQAFSVLLIFGSFCLTAVAGHRIRKVLALRLSGLGSYRLFGKERHVVITGNLNAEMMQDFLQELFHEDHAANAEELHAVFLVPRGSTVQLSAMLDKDLSHRLGHHLHNIHVFQGSVMDETDLERVCASQAECFFVLPNMLSSTPEKEDPENVIRAKALQLANPEAHIILMLMKAENQQSLKEPGGPNSQEEERLDSPSQHRRPRSSGESEESLMNNFISRKSNLQRKSTVMMKYVNRQLSKLSLLSSDAKVQPKSGKITCIAFDRIKLGLLAKTCQVPGFITFISNLCKSVQASEKGNKELWQQEYEDGVGKEVYQIQLSPCYANKRATFAEVVLDVLEHTDGQVVLIGLVETKDNQSRVLINPAPLYPIKDTVTTVLTSGIFIAHDLDAVQQLQAEGSQIGRHRLGFAGRRVTPSRSMVKAKVFEFLGRRERPMENALNEDDLMNATNSEGPMLEKSAVMKDRMDEAEHLDIPNNCWTFLSFEEETRARHLVSLRKRHQKALVPRKATAELLIRGGHVLLACLGAQGLRELRFSINHFVAPLRPAQQPGEAKFPPIVVLSPVPIKQWHSIVNYPEVYFLQGSGLNEFDIERANARAAKTIVIYQVGSPVARSSEYTWMLDSETICSLRLIDGILGPRPKTVVVADLLSDCSHHFLPGEVGGKTSMTRGSMSSINTPSSAPTSARSRRTATSHHSAFGATTLPRERYKPSGRRTMSSVSGQDHADEHLYEEVEYYLHSRFASGQLFVGTVMTSLAVNTFYNPALSQLVTGIVRSRMTTVRVPRRWVGRPYIELFENLLWVEKILPVGLFREPEVGQKYWYTAPPAKETFLDERDQIVCFGMAEAPKAEQVPASSQAHLVHSVTSGAGSMGQALSALRESRRE